MKNEFYFVRHGEAAYGPDSVTLDYLTDVPLTDRGLKQATSIQRVIEKLPIQTICVSPLLRALQTKQIIAENLNCNVVVIEELRECSGTIWNKMMEIKEKGDLISMPQEVQDFMHRSLRGINKALDHPGPVLIVAHGGIHVSICHFFEVLDHEKIIGNCVPVHFFQSEESQWRGRHLAYPIIE